MNSRQITISKYKDCKTLTIMLAPVVEQLKNHCGIDGRYVKNLTERIFPPRRPDIARILYPDCHSENPYLPGPIWLLLDEHGVNGPGPIRLQLQSKKLKHPFYKQEKTSVYSHCIIAKRDADCDLRVAWTQILRMVQDVRRWESRFEDYLLTFPTETARILRELHSFPKPQASDLLSHPPVPGASTCGKITGANKE